MIALGHKSPDTDTVVSAIAASYILTKAGFPCEPGMQGEASAETKFVLSKFGLQVPEQITSVAGRELCIVDTANPMELPSDLAEAKIKFIFDHHALKGITTLEPFNGFFTTAGCTCTVLVMVARVYNVAIPANIAGAMALAIVSDTVMFKSPTTTDYDKHALLELAKTAGIDYEKVGMEMLREKSKLTGETAESLVHRDYKEFDMNGKKVAIAQLELIDATVADEFVPAIREYLQTHKEANKFHSVIFFITDIMKEGSHLYVYSDSDGKVAEIMGCDLNNNCAWVPGLMSRKKQVVPPLAEKL